MFFEIILNIYWIAKERIIFELTKLFYCFSINYDWQYEPKQLKSGFILWNKATAISTDVIYAGNITLINLGYLCESGVEKILFCLQ